MAALISHALTSLQSSNDLRVAIIVLGLKTPLFGVDFRRLCNSYGIIGSTETETGYFGNSLKYLSLGIGSV